MTTCNDSYCGREIPEAEACSPCGLCPGCCQVYCGLDNCHGSNVTGWTDFVAPLVPYATVMGVARVVELPAPEWDEE